jgi:hypothetical protein
MYISSVVEMFSGALALRCTSDIKIGARLRRPGFVRSRSFNKCIVVMKQLY